MKTQRENNSRLTYPKKDDDGLSFTRYASNTHLRSFKFTQQIGESIAHTHRSKIGEIEQLYNDYNLFKYSKCFTQKRRSSVKNLTNFAAKKEKSTKNYKQIKKEGDKLKQRLMVMQTSRKLLLEKLKPLKKMQDIRIN